jgi:hypothetical protein
MAICRFAGRDRELDRLGQEACRVIEGSGRGVCFVTGPAGIGKTEICRQLMDDLGRRTERPLLAWHRLAGGQQVGEVGASLLRQLLEQTPATALLDRLSPYQRAVIARHYPEVLVKENQQLPDAALADRVTLAACWHQVMATAARGHGHGLLLWLVCFCR